MQTFQHAFLDQATIEFRIGQSTLMLFKVVCCGFWNLPANRDAESARYAGAKHPHRNLANHYVPRDRDGLCQDLVPRIASHPSLDRWFEFQRSDSRRLSYRARQQNPYRGNHCPQFVRANTLIRLPMHHRYYQDAFADAQHCSCERLNQLCKTHTATDITTDQRINHLRVRNAAPIG